MPRSAELLNLTRGVLQGSQVASLKSTAVAWVWIRLTGSAGSTPRSNAWTALHFPRTFMITRPRFEALTDRTETNLALEGLQLTNSLLSSVVHFCDFLRLAVSPHPRKRLAVKKMPNLLKSSADVIECQPQSSHELSLKPYCRRC